MVQDQRRVAFADNLRQVRIEGETTRIVDDLDAQIERLLRHRSLVRVYRNRRGQPAAQPLQNRSEALPFLGFRNAR
jgi:hypothetical protein